MKVSRKLKLALKSILSIQMGEVETDKAVLVFDGEELVEGMEVFVMVEDEPQVAEDGDYATSDGKTIKVVDGRVAEIVDPEAEVASDEPVEEIQEEANTEVDPVEEPEEEESADEDRIAVLESHMAEFTEGLNQIINTISAFESRIAELEGKLAKVEEPAADPVDENPEVEAHSKKNLMSYLRKD